MKGGAKVVVEPHRHAGVFIARGKEDALVTRNLVPGESVYGEKRISVDEGESKVEYRVWNPFRSKLAAAILGGVDHIYIQPGSKVLYLGASAGTTVSHVADIVGPVRTPPARRDGSARGAAAPPRRANVAPAGPASHPGPGGGVRAAGGPRLRGRVLAALRA